MRAKQAILKSLGNDLPLADDGRRLIERREISRRWLFGTALTGVTTTVLMGVALFAALDGRQQLAEPGESLAADVQVRHDETPVSRGRRVADGLITLRSPDKMLLELSTVVKLQDKDVIRRQPYAFVRTSLAQANASSIDYPRFDPLGVMTSGSSKSSSEDVPKEEIYPSAVESEVSLRTQPFPSRPTMPLVGVMSLEEIEASVRLDGNLLLSGGTSVVSTYVDPQRFADVFQVPEQGTAARVIEENASISVLTDITPDTEQFADDIIKIDGDTNIDRALRSAGYPQAQSEMLSGLLAARLSSDSLASGDMLRIGVIQKGQDIRVVRASVYRGTDHLTTISLDDEGRFVSGAEPSDVADGDGVLVGSAPVRNLPTVYDGIFRAALNNGMTVAMASTVVRVLAPVVDVQGQSKPSDGLEAFFSVSPESGIVAQDGDLLYFKANIGGRENRFYRFRDPKTGDMAYYDEEGNSVRQFLLRNPVPAAVSNSNFGMRLHPVLGFARMHTGVDYPAPRGTPIVAAGDGVVIKAGWDRGGYGNQTLIQHNNGYVSSYSHQSAIAKSVKSGSTVKQGQVIGYIGSTGMASGYHLHYELLVNGRRVDPLKVRLPQGASLQGEKLATFQSERGRIDTLLKSPAQAGGSDI